MFPSESEYEKGRRKRIAENKEMLAKLFPNGPSLSPNKNPDAQKSPKQPPRRRTIAFPLRRNPPRKARRFDSDFCNSDEEEDEDIVKFDDAPYTIIKIRGPLTEHLFRKKADCNFDLSSSELDSDSDDDGSLKRSRKRRKQNSRRAVAKPWVEVTEEDLILVAERVADKRYDRECGTSCHQCRQKTDDLKTMCKSDSCVGIRGQFCGPCLRNRYGENAKEAIMDPEWTCPPCRGICNCSFCMKKRGKSCTGIMIHVAKQNGFEDVKSFLGD